MDLKNEISESNGELNDLSSDVVSNPPGLIAALNQQHSQVALLEKQIESMEKSHEDDIMSEKARFDGIHAFKNDRINKRKEELAELKEALSIKNGEYVDRESESEEEQDNFDGQYALEDRVKELKKRLGRGQHKKELEQILDKMLVVLWRKNRVIYKRNEKREVEEKDSSLSEDSEDIEDSDDSYAQSEEQSESDEEDEDAINEKEEEIGDEESRSSLVQSTMKRSDKMFTPNGELWEEVFYGDDERAVDAEFAKEGAALKRKLSKLTNVDKVVFIQKQIEQIEWWENEYKVKATAGMFEAGYIIRNEFMDESRKEIAELKESLSIKNGEYVDRESESEEEQENIEEALHVRVKQLMKRLGTVAHKKALEQIHDKIWAVLARKNRLIYKREDEGVKSDEEENSGVSQSVKKVTDLMDKLEVKNENAVKERDDNSQGEVMDASVYFKFPNVSMLTSEPKYQKPAVLNGVEWLVSLHKNGEFLACTVAGKAIKGNSFPDASVNFDLNSAEDYCYEYFKTLEKRVHEGTHFYENLQFIPIQDLFDVKKELVTDDTVTVGVHIDFRPIDNFFLGYLMC